MKIVKKYASWTLQPPPWSVSDKLPFADDVDSGRRQLVQKMGRTLQRRAHQRNGSGVIDGKNLCLIIMVKWWVRAHSTVKENWSRYGYSNAGGDKWN